MYLSWLDAVIYLCCLLKQFCKLKVKLNVYHTFWLCGCFVACIINKTTKSLNWILYFFSVFCFLAFNFYFNILLYLGLCSRKLSWQKKTKKKKSVVLFTLSLVFMSAQNTFDSFFFWLVFLYIFWDALTALFFICIIVYFGSVMSLINEAVCLSVFN